MNAQYNTAAYMYIYTRKILNRGEMKMQESLIKRQWLFSLRKRVTSKYNIMKNSRIKKEIINDTRQRNELQKIVVETKQKAWEDFEKTWKRVVNRTKTCFAD